MREIKAIIRVERVPSVVAALKGAGIKRFYVSHVHVLGSGVDPEDFHMSLDEGEIHTEKAKVEMMCEKDRTSELCEVIREAARTGHQGDGVLVLTDLSSVVNIRTGDDGRLALL